jgi:acyl-CoA dehydrogenase
MAFDYGALDRGRGVNYWTYDPVLRREVRRTVPDDEWAWIDDRLDAFGETVGTTIAENADIVDDNPPELRTYDREGAVINEVEYHPAHLENERLTYEAGGVADAFRTPPDRDERVSLVYNLAAGYLLGTVDIGLACPFAMTAGAALVLEAFSDHDAYFEALTARDYDDLATGAMFLTEIQGGSDVGATETVAEHVQGDVYELTGEKWFASNIDAEVVLALARRPGAPEGTAGLSLFVLPRTKRDGGLASEANGTSSDERSESDGASNDYQFRRLKDKLGTESVPTGEVELRGAEAYLVGEPERGFTYMAEMLNMERLHNAVGSVGTMRRALLESTVKAADREAFGSRLDEKPLMRRDLVDMTVDHEAAAAFTFDAARAFDRYHRATERDGVDPEGAYRLLRMLVPVAKHRTGRMAVDTASYAIEVQGGNGYTEEWITERLLRDAQVLPVWEGTSNVLSLDVLRAMAHEGAHVATLDRVRTYLAEADDHAPLADDAQTVRAELGGLEDALATLGTADTDYAELHAKDFADYVFDVYAGALLLAEAARDLGADDPDARKALVARRWIDRHLRDLDARGITTGDRLPLEQFDAIVRFAEADPAELVERSAAD